MLIPLAICTYSDIYNCYFGYLKLLFSISRIIISDIRNYAEKAFYLRYSKKLFWTSKKQFRISENEYLFQISKIVTLDIRYSYFGYP